jgi:hypothetical protein
MGDALVNNDRNAYTELADAAEHRARLKAQIDSANHEPLFAQTKEASAVIAAVLVFACAVLAWILPLGPTP